MRTADTTIFCQVTYPHEVVYSPSAQPVAYEQISSRAFVNGYITIMSKELPHIKALLLTHLQELMEEGEYYGWLAVRAYHAAWLHHIEQGRTAWGDDERKMTLWAGMALGGTLQQALIHTFSRLPATSPIRPLPILP